MQLKKLFLLLTHLRRGEGRGRGEGGGAGGGGGPGNNENKLRRILKERGEREGERVGGHPSINPLGGGGRKQAEGDGRDGGREAEREGREEERKGLHHEIHPDEMQLEQLLLSLTHPLRRGREGRGEGGGARRGGSASVPEEEGVRRWKGMGEMEGERLGGRGRRRSPYPLGSQGPKGGARPWWIQAGDWLKEREVIFELLL